MHFRHTFGVIRSTHPILLLAPVAAFAWLTAMAASMVLLGFFPSSYLLWFVNLELVQPNRELFYLLELVFGPNGYGIFVFCLCGYLAGLWAFRSRNRIALFLISHLSVLLLAIPLVRSGEVIRMTMGGILLPGPNALFLVPAIAACAVVHISFVTDIRRCFQSEMLSRQG